MAYKITEECISCGLCEPECPNAAISVGADIYIIDPEKCTQCLPVHDSPRCASVCPVEACVPDPEHSESKEELIAKYKRLHPEEG